VIGIVEAVDHRQAIALPVGQAGADQPPGRAIGRRFAVFDHLAVDRGVFDHVGEIDLVHRRHAAAGMARAKIALQQFELFGGRPWPTGCGDQIGIALEIALLGGRGAEFTGHHPHRDAGGAIGAAGAIGDVWLRRNPIRPSASFSWSACGPFSSVNTLRSLRPGR
jgi:hypothetical protein